MRYFFLLVIISVVNGCPNGTVLSPSNDVCYKVVNGSKIWLDAEFDCLRSGGNLAVPRNAFENSALVSLANKNFDKLGNFWIGGSTFIANNGNRAWVDRSNMSYTKLAHGKWSLLINSKILRKWINRLFIRLPSRGVTKIIFSYVYLTK